jgi:hypothetical protein
MSTEKSQAKPACSRQEKMARQRAEVAAGQTVRANRSSRGQFAHIVRNVHNLQIPNTHFHEWIWRKYLR